MGEVFGLGVFVKCDDIVGGVSDADFVLQTPGGWKL
jgi:hypothetical protein